MAAPICTVAKQLYTFPPPAALKGRMTDSNRNLAAKVLVLLGDIAKAMGPPFDRGARPVLLFPAVANLADNKVQGETLLWWIME